MLHACMCISLKVDVFNGIRRYFNRRLMNLSPLRAVFHIQVWFTTIQMPLEKRELNLLEYKFLIKKADGKLEWEDGPNRELPLHLPLAFV